MNDFDKKWQNFLIKSSSKLGINIDQKMATKFSKYAYEIIRWNKKMNLTTITSPIDIAVKHFIDSLIILPILSDNTSLLDVGTGGGFPGIPLKIALDNINISLIESSGKKVSFLKYIIRTLNLFNIKAFAIRAEDAKKLTDFPYNFDVVVCRGFANFTNFFEIASYFIKKKGLIIAFKGKNWKKELNKDIISLNPNLSFQVYKYILPILNYQRSIVVVVRKGSSNILNLLKTNNYHQL